MDSEKSIFENAVLSYGIKSANLQRRLLDINNQLVTAPKESVSVQRLTVLAEAVNAILKRTTDACELAKDVLSQLSPSFEMDSEKSIFENAVLSYGIKVENLQRRLLDINNQESVSMERLPVLTEAVNAILKRTTDACELAEDVLSPLPPSIRWTAGGQRGTPLEMVWVYGITPMDFWLRHTHQDSQLEELIQTIKLKWSGGQLVKEASPKEGSSIVISNNKKTYRGYVASVSPKIRVLNVDDGKERDEELSSCYKLTTEFTVLPANFIRCSLGKGYLKDAWKWKYCEDFLDLLRESRLSVKILKKLASRPSPTFLVQLHAFNEDKEIEVDLRDWLRDEFQIVLPD